MAGRDDFGSGMKSPGGWSGGGGGISGGIGGAKSSGGAYNYSFMPGARPNTKAIGNWNTGGAKFGFGTPQGASDALRDMFNPQPQAPVQSGPIRPALGPQGLPSLLGVPQPGAYPQPPAEEMPPAPPETIPGWQPQRYVNPGYGMDPNGIGRTVNPTTAPRGYFGPANPSFTPAGAGGPSSYSRMGNDFRSTNLSPSSYPGGDGITGNDMGGGGWRR
jgi:hypothetical protein